MRGIRSISTVLVLSSVLLTGGATAAQEATPGGIDLSPNADQCTQTPRTIEAIEAIASTPITVDSAVSSAVPNVAQGHIDLPTGEPAPKDAIDGIVATVVANIACFNAGNYLALFGGWTDAYLLTQIGAAPYSQQFVDMVSATPVALPESEQTQLLDTREFTRYPDGRAGVLVYFRSPDTQPNGDVQIELWIFKNLDGRWLLDESIPNLAEQLKDVATPAAG